MKTAVFAFLALLATPAMAAPAAPTGTWRNARDTVRIRVAPCGGGLCGTVVAADERAKADAAAGGTAQLVGTQLFRDFRRGDDGMWHGSVFVPDIGSSFDGTLALDGADTLVGAGCILPGVCRETRWTRVAAR